MPFQIVRNDITKMHVDAIVNTANPMPGYGAGIDTAVYEAAGVKELLTKRHEIGMIERGHSVITDGFKLPAKHIIHTVGTAWQGGFYGEEDIIRNCYRSVFQVAEENDIESLAIPLLASGNYGFPKGIALRIALSEIEAFMSNHDIELYLVVFDEKSFSLSSELYGDIDEYINDNYVEEKTSEEHLSFHQIRDERPLLSAPSFTGGAVANTFRKDLEKGRKRKGTAKQTEVYADFEDADACEMICATPLAEKSLDDVVKNLDKTFMELVFSFADERGTTDAGIIKYRRKLIWIQLRKRNHVILIFTI